MVVSTVATPQEGPQFNSTIRPASVCVGSLWVQRHALSEVRLVGNVKLPTGANGC